MKTARSSLSTKRICGRWNTTTRPKETIMANTPRTLTLQPSPLGCFATDERGNYLDVWIRPPHTSHRAMWTDQLRPLTLLYPDAVIETNGLDVDLADLYV